jgi:hypothetical protein
MSRFMDATASFTGVSLEMPKKVRSAETLSAKDAIPLVCVSMKKLSKYGKQN